MKEKLFFIGVKALIRNDRDEILLLLADVSTHRKNVTAYWDIPGGRIEKGDDAQTTLRRELQEETGITNISDIRTLGSCISNHEIPLDDGTTVGLALIVFDVTVPPENISVKLSAEHSQFGWFGREDAVDRLAHKYPKEFTDLL